MPKLHHSDEFGTKPDLKKIFVSSQNLDNLITVWNFCNTFSEFLNVPHFKLEELEAALRWEGTHQSSDN